VTLAQSLRGGVESTRPTHTNVPSTLPIIVGVVVGVVVLAVVGGLCAFFLIRRKNKRRSRGSSAYEPVLMKAHYSSDMAHSTGDSLAPTSPGKLYVSVIQISAIVYILRNFQNPNDPSTYPTTCIPSDSSPDSLSYGLQSQNFQQQNPSSVVSGRSKAPLANSYFSATPEL